MPATSPPTPPKAPLPPDSQPRCRNCGAAVPIQFCSTCGQNIKERKQSIGRLAGEVSSNMLATDSRLFRSLALLIFKPGALAERALDGKWQSYVPPLRLYLFFSLLCFFTVPNFGPEHAQLQGGSSTGDIISSGTADGAKTDMDGVIPGDSAQNNVDKLVAFLDTKLADEGGGWLQPLLEVVRERAISYEKMPADRRKGFIFSEVRRALPTFFLLVLPLFAMGMKILYFFTGRLFFEHFIFGLHFYSFALFTTALSATFGNATTGLWLYLLIIPGYLFLALQRVYRQPWMLTGLKMPLLAILHVFIFVVVMLSVFLYALFQF